MIALNFVNVVIYGILAIAIGFGFFEPPHWLVVAVFAFSAFDSITHINNEKEIARIKQDLKNAERDKKELQYQIDKHNR